MPTVNAYLNFNGNCLEAFNFYQSVFGGEFTYVGRFKDMPPENPVSPDDSEKIMHISLPLSAETSLMGSDTLPGYGPPYTMGNNMSLYINTSSEEEAQRIFDALAAEGTVTMPMEKTFWGSFFGMLTDKYGFGWMLGYDYNQSTAPDQQQQQQQQQQ